MILMRWSCRASCGETCRYCGCCARTERRGRGARNAARRIGAVTVATGRLPPAALVKLQEHLVERRPAHADLVDGYRSVVEAADHCPELARSARGGSAGASPAPIKRGRVGGDTFEDLANGFEPGCLGNGDLDDVTPDARLELAERAGCDRAAVVDHYDVVGELDRLRRGSGWSAGHRSRQ